LSIVTKATYDYGLTAALYNHKFVPRARALLRRSAALKILFVDVEFRRGAESRTLLIR
jgi:hypothetical protein